MSNIYSNIAQMEKLFSAAVEATSDPVKRTILIGMYNDWINFKYKAWKDAFYMLEKGEHQVLTG